MKYIRTKDKIYDGSLLLREYTGWYFYESTKHYAFNESEIIKQSDTIEELCDEFVGIRKSDKKSYLGKITKSGIFFEELGGWVGRIDNYETFYGAIWTDKGLIYVAKMNDKGELELL